MPANDCEDLVQDIFLQACRGQARFRGDSLPMCWLFRIANRVVAKTWTKNLLWRAALQFDGALDQMQFDGPSPLEITELREFTRLLDRALDLAGAESRRLIIANALGPPTDSDDATGGSLKAGTRWVRLHRARKRLMCILMRNQKNASMHRMGGLAGIRQRPQLRPWSKAI